MDTHRVVLPSAHGHATAGKTNIRAAPTPSLPDSAEGRDRSGSLEVRQPPAKRARKAVNCEPCRNSKLKCDRNRPCSSCVLRGTTAQCYQGQDSVTPRPESVPRNPIDALGEISRIRQSLNVLESHIKEGGNSSGATFSASLNNTLSYTNRSHDASAGPCRGDPTPGKLCRSGTRGLYTGPTSAAANMVTDTDKDDSDSSEPPACSSGRSYAQHAPSSTVYDEDLVSQLPSVDTVDQLIAYYFEYCNWMYHHVNQPAFLAEWARFKSGEDRSRVILGTVCIIIAITIRYLSVGHPIIADMPAAPEVLSTRYYGVMLKVLKRHREDAESITRTYTMALVELLLAQAHYLTFAKEDPEDVWALSGELVSIGTAMGLHCDPSKTRYELSVAERRRWAWWHIMTFERWQAFMFGRPLHIAPHHFDTQLPTYCDPALDKSGRLYLPNLALFRLGYILGDIMDDAVSFRVVSYSTIQEKDMLLENWYNSLPTELHLDHCTLARCLASTEIGLRRIAVQSVILSCAFYHIRFMLHRPYVKIAPSLETAVSAASELIALFSQAFTAEKIPGHFNWGAFHVFSASMFFSFQLITNPNHPGTGHYREQIRKAVYLLDRNRALPVAEKALTILETLEPLYSDEWVALSAEERSRKKVQVLKAVKALAFPYQDPPYARNATSPSYRPFTPDAVPMIPQSNDAESGGSSTISWAPHPGHSTVSPTMRTLLPSHAFHHAQMHHQSTEGTDSSSQYSRSMHSRVSTDSPHSEASLQAIRGQRLGNTLPPLSHFPSTTASYGMRQSSVMQRPLSHHAQSVEGNGVAMHPADESSMWGASVGFGLGEWARFLDVVQRPECSSNEMENLS
ncbi:hypothetical protein IEO21_01021 [Rhodonia placenta]|uniref:Zn(2)-C6 fungal-type domain-containing protein n=1 Tax=Rhodonia placenta TaxID=104341 RepID=A0A8H7U6M5_9APHY|nr:hypothetical protein IEO21_01021 [Postia placenta]